MAAARILIVDDTAVNLKLTRILLANQGYQVFIAASAEDAVPMVQTHRPHLVLTDLHLPGMDGLTFTRLIKADQSTRNTIVLALSAFSDIEEEAEALRAGCDGCISKPIDTKAFARQVGEYLHRRETGQVTDAALPEPLSDSALLPLRRRFLEESAGQARQWIVDLEGELDSERAARSVHQWIGAAGLLGYPEISEMARDLEAAFRTRPMDSGELRETLDELLRAFAAHQTGRKPKL